MKLLPAGDERRKDMARGAFVGMMLPSLILVIVLLRQFGADSTVTSRDSGAPLEIQERLHPIVRRPPVRRVYAGGRNKTVSFSAANPYKRGNFAPPLLRGNGTAAALAKPWELREAKNAKQLAKAVEAKSKIGKAILKAKQRKEEQAAAAAGAANAAVFPAPAPLRKAQKVFDAAKTGKGFAPGAAVEPAEGAKLASLKSFTNLLAKKCVSIVGFYNSEDAEMSREFAVVWNAVAGNEATKFGAAYVDVATKGGLEIAVNATVVRADGDARAAVGTPAILEYYVRGDSSVFKTTYKDAREVGAVGARAGKDAAAASKDDAVAGVTKKLANHAEGQQFAISKEGCFLKHATKAKADAADAAKKDAKAKAQKAKDKAAKKDASGESKKKKDKKDLEEKEADAMTTA